MIYKMYVFHKGILFSHIITRHKTGAITLSQ